MMAWELLSRPGVHAQGCSPNPIGEKHCVITAIGECHSDAHEKEQRLYRFLDEIGQCSIVGWNDTTSHADVVATLRRLDI